MRSDSATVMSSSTHPSTSTRNVRPVQRARALACSTPGTSATTASPLASVVVPGELAYGIRHDRTDRSAPQRGMSGWFCLPHHRMVSLVIGALFALGGGCFGVYVVTRAKPQVAHPLTGD
jgi:hypothetical protein